MHPLLSFLNGLLTLLFVTSALLVAILYFVKVRFDRPGPLTTSAVVVIPKGEGVSGIAERLERDGVIDDRRVFMTSILYFIYFKGKGSLKAGEYEFRKNASMRQVLDTLVEGKSIDHKFTVAEGLTSQQIVERLMADPDLEGDIAVVPPEGTLLPDTYKFGLGDTRQDILERMENAQAKFLANLWEKRDEDIVVKTPEEAVDPRFDRGEGDGPRGRAAAYRKRVPEPPQEEHAPAVRSHHHLRPGRREGGSRSSYPARRARARDALQHL